jgi:hypothetical protein
VDENRLFTEAAQVGRFKLDQNQPGGSKLPESDRDGHGGALLSHWSTIGGAEI